MKDWIGDGNSIWKTLGASNHTDEERERDDFYATDPDAVDKLLAVEKLNSRIWECAAGAGHLSERLKEYGYIVYSTDIKTRGYYLDAVQDFLTTENIVLFDGRYDILTNPPYKYAKEFVKKSLDLLPVGCKCYMFLKLQFLEGVARYNEIFSITPPKAVYVFKKRVLCAKNGEFERMREGGGSAVAYAWFVWEEGYNGKTVLKDVNAGLALDNLCDLPPNEDCLTDNEFEIARKTIAEQKAEIERLTKVLDDTVSMNEMYIKEAEKNA